MTLEKSSTKSYKKAVKILDPKPVGWFAVATSEELKKGDTKEGILCTQAYQIKRDLRGYIHYSGCIGAISEQNGFIMAWHHPKGDAPEWQVPILDNTGWRPMRFYSLTARSHPQETFENSIDMAHFPKVHGFKDIKVIQFPEFEKNTMNVQYRISRNHPIPFLKDLTPEFEVRVHGLGCAHNHIHIDDFGLNVRMFAMSTPTTVGHVEIRLGVSVHNDLGLPLSRLILPLVHRGIGQNIVNDFCQDIEIWENKEYKAPPVLVRGDGPISKFRQWCQKYYLEEVNAEEKQTSTASNVVDFNLVKAA